MKGSGSSGVSEPSDSQCTKEPCQTKEGHDTCNTDEQSDGGFYVHLLFGMFKCVSGVCNEDPNYYDENDQIQEQYGKDGPQEGTKEYCRIKDKAAGGRNENTKYLSMLVGIQLQVSCSVPCINSATYNPSISVVFLRTTRSLLTASARSTAIGITTGMIGTTM